MPSKVGASKKFKNGNRRDVAIVGTQPLYLLQHRSNAPKHIDTGIGIKEEHRVNPPFLRVASPAAQVCEMTDQQYGSREKNVVAKASSLSG
jgi:hypothetical protein